MLTLFSPLDMHLHLREGSMLELVAPFSTQQFAAAVIMPNLVPPVTSAERLRNYRSEIERVRGTSSFQPLMTLFMQPYSLAFLQELRPELFAIKLYPEGVTTNSSGGISDFASIEPTLAAMEQLGIPLLVHGETHGFVLDREAEFLPTYRDLATRFPKLTIVMEHITTRAALELLEQHDNLFATVTLHHLLITLDDMAGGLLQPHLFCKPIAKRPEDRDALLQFALAAHPKLSFGSDSAPHPRERKEASGCAAGVFSAPVILPALAELFNRHSRLESLQAFVSDNAQRIYRFVAPKTKVTLAEEPWQVPLKYGDVVPFLAGQSLPWRVVTVETLG